MFPVDVPSHNIVERVPERALFTKVHCFFHTISLSGSIKIGFVILSQCNSLRVSIVLPCWFGHVEYFNVRLQSSLACSECAVWTVEQNFAVKDFPVHIAEMILVAWVVFGRKGALCAAEWLRSVFLRDIMGQNNGFKINVICAWEVKKALDRVVRFTCVLEYDGSHPQISRQRVPFTNWSFGQKSLNSCEGNWKD